MSFREDGAKLQIKFFEVGLQPHLSSLHSSRSLKAPQMAFAPRLWGLQVWSDGRAFFLLDERGFVCSTEDEGLALKLILFESIEGPGALRAVLSRPVISPMSTVQVLESRFRPKAPVPAAKAEPSPKPLRRRKLSEGELSNLLKDL